MILLQSCEVGYRRVNAQLYDGQCAECKCLGHSEECHPATGHCLDCQHNTAGPGCEQCKPGFFGDPSLGGLLGACRPCACPSAENSHSASCTLSRLLGAEGAGPDDFVCNDCEAGYEGDKCER